MRSFPSLVDELVADARRAPDVGELELEALGFALAFEGLAEDPDADAQAVVDELARHAAPHADAVLRAFALYGLPPLRDRAAGAAIDLGRSPAREVGRIEARSAWRIDASGIVADVLRLDRPSAPAQAFLLVTGPDDLGAPLLGGGLSPMGEEDEHLGELMQGLGAGELQTIPPTAVLDRLDRGRQTTEALMLEVSVTLAMGTRVASHAVLGGGEPPPELVWALDETESDDDRAEYADRLLHLAFAEGADPRDPDALAVWFERFQQRRPREQLKQLGLPSVPSADEPGPGRRTRGSSDRRAKRKAARKARRRNR